MVEELAAAYGEDIRLVYRHFPLVTIHDKAQITAEAAEAAGAQGKFWEMHDLLYERQDEWTGTPEAEMIDMLAGYAEEVEVEDIDQFRSDLENETYKAKVEADYQTALEKGLNSTPSFFVNQVIFPSQALGLSYQGLDTFIQLMALRERWYQQPEQVIDPDKDYVATIETEKGDIVVDLATDTAPVNVNSFAFLAQNDWYVDTTFHRVLPGFVAQAGDPTGTGIGFPGYRCDNEVTPDQDFAEAGVVALANSGPNTNGSQFFITYDAVPQLNADFTIIGRVIEGQDVAESLTPRDPTTDPNAEPGDKILGIHIEEKE